MSGTAKSVLVIKFMVLLLVRVLATVGEECPPITLGGGSPLYPESTVRGSVTMYRIFHTLGNPPLVNITWFRSPSKLSLSSGRYHIGSSFSNGTVNAAIKLWNLKLYPDLGKYTVTVCSNCTCNYTTFVLTLFKCDPTALPQPVNTYITMNITESPSKTVHIFSIFNGSTSSFFYPTFWTHKDQVICTEDGASLKGFTCNRTVLEINCLFYVNLYISEDYTTNISGNYTVEAVGGGSASRNSTVHIDVSKETKSMSETPSKGSRIYSCGSGPLAGDSARNANFSCQISNYSDSVQVVIVEDNEREYNESTEDLSFGCRTQIVDSTLASCTVNISSSVRSGKRRYKLCAGGGKDLRRQQHHCSETITVVPGGYSGIVLECMAIALLMVIILIVLVRGSMRRRARGVVEKCDSFFPSLHHNEKESDRQTAMEYTTDTNVPIKTPPFPIHLNLSPLNIPGSSPSLPFVKTTDSEHCTSPKTPYNRTANEYRTLEEEWKIDLYKNAPIEKLSDEYKIQDHELKEHS